MRQVGLPTVENVQENPPRYWMPALLIGLGCLVLAGVTIAILSFSKGKPAELMIHAEPAGATVAIQDSQRNLVKTGVIGIGGELKIDGLAPGAYMIELQAPGRTPVAQAALLTTGQRTALGYPNAIVLPLAPQAPTAVVPVTQPTPPPTVAPPPATAAVPPAVTGPPSAKLGAVPTATKPAAIKPSVSNPPKKVSHPVRSVAVTKRPQPRSVPTARVAPASNSEPVRTVSPTVEAVTSQPVAPYYPQRPRRAAQGFSEPSSPEGRPRRPRQQFMGDGQGQPSPEVREMRRRMRRQWMREQMMKEWNSSPGSSSQPIPQRPAETW